jgi:hypothetical protein
MFITTLLNVQFYLYSCYFIPLNTNIFLCTLFSNTRTMFFPCVSHSYYVCVRGGPNQPLHRDPQWSIVLTVILNYRQNYNSLHFNL